MENDSAGPDGGIDLVIIKDGKRYLVQCKQWRSQKVGVKVVREMFGLVAAENAAGGIVITSGQLTLEAGKFATGKPLELVDGEQLATMIDTVQKEQKTAPASATVTTNSNIELNDQPCPVCSSKMILRTARKGKNTGKQFWGCSGFPKCRGTSEYRG